MIVYIFRSIPRAGQSQSERDPCRQRCDRRQHFAHCQSVDSFRQFPNCSQRFRQEYGLPSQPWGARTDPPLERPESRVEAM